MYNGLTDEGLVLALDRIFYILRDYPKKHNTKAKVMNTVVERLSNIYDISIHDKDTIRIHNDLFRIFSYKEYNCFDVQHIGIVKGDD